MSKSSTPSQAKKNRAMCALRQFGLPHFGLPDRLCQRREDERLLRGRGGITRAWLPVDPCCCDPPCPEDCSECPPLKITIDGWTGYCGGGNGSYNLEPTAWDNCVWRYEGPTAGGVEGFDWINITLYCEGSAWYLHITYSSWGPEFLINGDWLSDPHPHTTNCPPLGEYDVTDRMEFGGTCNKPAVTLEL